jgi:hypothetical protein
MSQVLLSYLLTFTHLLERHSYEVQSIVIILKNGKSTPQTKMLSKGLI